jgi:hypothetical protein
VVPASFLTVDKEKLRQNNGGAMLAQYDVAQRQLILRLEPDETEADFKALGDLLIQFLDRKRQRTGTEIQKALSSAPKQPARS